MGWYFSPNTGIDEVAERFYNTELGHAYVIQINRRYSSIPSIFGSSTEYDQEIISWLHAWPSIFYDMLDADYVRLDNNAMQISSFVDTHELYSSHIDPQLIFKFCTKLNKIPFCTFQETILNLLFFINGFRVFGYRGIFLGGFLFDDANFYLNSRGTQCRNKIGGVVQNPEKLALIDVRAAYNPLTGQYTPNHNCIDFVRKTKNLMMVPLKFEMLSFPPFFYDAYTPKTKKFLLYVNLFTTFSPDTFHFSTNQAIPPLRVINRFLNIDAYSIINMNLLQIREFLNFMCYDYNVRAYYFGSTISYTPLFNEYYSAATQMLITMFTSIFGEGRFTSFKVADIPEFKYAADWSDYNEAEHIKLIESLDASLHEALNNDIISNIESFFPEEMAPDED